jgi:diguanylate cyclase (GGDEF)-like protein
VDSEELCSVLAARLTQRRSIQVEQAMRPGLTVRIAYEPMADGGTVVTFEDVTEKRQYEERIAFMARHDALTGLPNRTLLREHMAEAAARPGDGTRYAVLCLDLDRFKEVNDTLGHAAGDELLRLVAGRLRGCAREQDLIARLGGDEFAIVLTAEDDAHAPAASLAARIVEAIGEPFDVQGQSLLIGTSIGIALPDRGEPACAAPDARRRTAELLLKRADIALYRAKEERGTYVFFEPGMDEVLNMRRGLEADLRLALEYDEFELNFMPLYNLAEDRVTGFEALVRWNSPARGRVAPADFIAVAEQTGLIVPLGEWVLRTACFEAAAWPDDVLVAVNLSPVQFKSKQLVAMVCEALRESGLPATRLELEITETVLLRDTEAVMTVLRSLHELGVRVSMDDFGTGYSSLSYLRRFPFDKIKIDRSFVNDLRASPAGGAESGDPRSAAAKSAATIVRAIACLGENLGIATTAEGVETAEQLAEIRSAGCTEVQGYYIGPPRPASEVPAMLRRREAAAPPAKSELYLSARQVA